MRSIVVVIVCGLFLGITLVMAGCASSPSRPTAASIDEARRVPPLAEEAWRGLHVPLFYRESLPWLHRALREVMVPRGLNTLIVEVDFQFQFTSHPELADPRGMNKEDARELAALCRELGVRLIPQFQCFGHQGSRPNTFLRTYPELMAPPNPDYNDPLHYQTSWNPLHPKTNEIVFALFDELIDAFQPEFFHVGMDEVMLFPDETTPYYNGETNAQIFAKAANDYYDYLVRGKGLTMLMWGDRLIDQASMRYNRFESSDLDTAAAIHDIPRDVIICDWHYMRLDDYPSVRYFQAQGFRVWPASWRSHTAALALYENSLLDATDNMLGHLCTTWCDVTLFFKILLGEAPDAEESHSLAAARTFMAVSEVW